MTKFSKELEALLIPEWKEFFVNYRPLKKHVKKIKLSRKPKQVPHHPSNLDFGLSLFDPVRALVNKFHEAGEEKEIIQVRRKNTDGQDEEEGEVYKTDLVQLFSEEDEIKLFFERLRQELKKVNQFYETKEREFLNRGEILNNQLDILLDLKKVLSDRHRKNKSSGFQWSYSSSARDSDFSDTPTELSKSPSENSQTDDVIAALERNGINLIGAETRGKTKKGKPLTTMRIDIPATTPTKTISAVTATLWEDLVNNPKKEGQRDFINKKKIQCAEKMIRGAFVELYRGLGLLKTYSSLNMLAFTKILKKFDKVANQPASTDFLQRMKRSPFISSDKVAHQHASTNFLQEVKRSLFISSDKVVKLMDEVETIFTMHFAENDRKKAMKYLRPRHHKDSHTVTFFVGLFTGCFFSLFIVYAMLAHISGMFSQGSEASYVEIVYPVFSMFALLSLHLFMYGCNLFMWKTTRINYNFIFEFKSSTALKFRDAFLICTSIMTAVVGAMVIHLIMLSTDTFPQQVNAIPGILLLIFTIILICPFNIFYRSTRYCLLRIIRNIVCSPFYKVLMVDFFMADQLTSQIPLMRHMESTACYFLAETFKTHQYETCKTGKFYRELVYLISFAPYYWRAMQCARRWFDECDINQLANLGKYVSAMVAAGARLTYARDPESNLWLIIVIATSIAATIYQLYWDFVKDWGFFDVKSKNPCLRNNLILKNKSIYYISMVINFFLRVAWVETVLHFNIGMLESRVLDFSLASLEVIRRGHWNFYRLENEHLNNVGKFRAVNAVPLPFRETDSEE